MNPWLKYISPFSKLYDKYEDASAYGWAMFFMSDPDEDINKLYRYNLQSRREYIKGIWPDIDF
jgi:hypothetical protein